MKEATSPNKSALNALRKISAPIPDKKDRDSTIINALMVDSYLWQNQINKKATLQAAPNNPIPIVTPLTLKNESKPQPTIIPQAPTLKQVQSTKQFHKIKETDTNIDSKHRLQKKYEAALQKLSQLQSHYQLRKTEKNKILNHATEGSPKNCRVAI